MVTFKFKFDGQIRSKSFDSPVDAIEWAAKMERMPEVSDLHQFVPNPKGVSPSLSVSP